MHDIVNLRLAVPARKKCASIETMNGKTKMTPKDFFLNLGVIVSLYVGVVSWLALLFQLIDKSFPDILEHAYQGDFYSSGARGAIATLVIVFPLFLWLSKVLRKNFIENPEKKEIGLRKWLVHITLFLAGAAIVVDLIILINAFLGGELSTRFILKIVAVLIVASIIFGFYLSDLKKKEWTNKRWPSILISLLVLSTLIWGFSSVGSPFNQRLVRIDERKINDLSSIQWQIISFWQSKGRLPESLSELADPISGFQIPADPETGAPYLYRVVKPDSFEFCANFNLASQDQKLDKAAPKVAIDGYSSNWTHEAGKVCFSRSIDRELYPVRKN